MTYARNDDGPWVELPVGQPVTHEDVVASYGTLELWTEAERNAFNVYTIVDEPPSEPGKMAVRKGLESFVNGRPAWVYELVPTPVQPAQPVTMVTSAQAQVALYNRGLLDEVEAILANHPYGKIRIWFRAARNWELDNPYVRGMALELGIDDDNLIALFEEANQILE